MKTQWKYTVFLLLAGLFITLYFTNRDKVEETISYFPIDSTLQFQYASTHLIPDELNNTTYALNWKVESSLERSAYLRQDVSLLYKNGRLEKSLKSWKQNRQRLFQKEKVKGNTNAKYETITFHYAELHHTEDTFTSVQQLSKDKIYTTVDPAVEFFHSPLSRSQKKAAQTADKVSESISKKAISTASSTFHLDLGQYTVISLTDLPAKKNSWLSLFPEDQREAIIGKLWEGLYKNYVLGIKKEDGTILNPQGSSIPQLFAAKNKTELLILFVSKDGTPFMLRQKL